MSSVKIIRNAFDVNFLSGMKPKLFESRAKCGGKVRCNYMSWSQDIIEHSAPIFVHDIEDVELRKELYESTKLVVPEIERFKSVTFMHYMWTRNSYIPWHYDGSWGFGATIYLNEYWDRNWGGYFAFEDEKGIHCVKPEFNTMVYVEPPVLHTVFTTNNNAAIRETIQIFGTL